MSCLQMSWPEQIVRVQSLSESGLRSVPERYIKPLSDRPSFNNNQNNSSSSNNNNNIVFSSLDADINIPVIDLANAFSADEALRLRTLAEISVACKEWGFFQVVNHGVSHELMRLAREAWREFFALPLDVKQDYANDPCTYEGYGSRLGVVKGAKLDWSDYFFLHFMPPSLRNPNKWPTVSPTFRNLIEEYGEATVKLCGKLMKLLSINLGLGEDYLLNAFGGEDNVGACLRANFFPKCPQPDLTLGLSSHSDPGGMTLLLPDPDVPGLQVRKDGNWVTVKIIPNAFIVNLADQMQVVSNAYYKSVEHRVIVNSTKERISLALFYNPKSDLLIGPAKELISDDRPALYPTMTFGEYRLYVRTNGPCGKTQVDSLTSPR